MIVPRGFPGIAFGEAADGDPRTDQVARARMAEHLGIPDQWAVIDQVHGTHVAVVDAPGHFGEADGMFTTSSMLPLAVATADCVPAVLIGEHSIAIVHAGWRGLAAGVVTEAHRLMATSGDTVTAAIVGPHIGPCCYEVGPEVIAAFDGDEHTTSSGTPSVDLSGAISRQLSGVPIVADHGCTMHDERFHSFRLNETQRRQVTVAWIPQA